MSEPPKYTVARGYDEIEALREVIDALRSDNDRLLRLGTPAELAPLSCAQRG